MKTEVCVCACDNTKCRWNEKNCKTTESDRILVYMKTQLRCEGYSKPKNGDGDGSKNKSKKPAAGAKSGKTSGKKKE